MAATLPFLHRHLRAMVELQRLTGMRPGEVYRLCLSEVDRAGPVWFYRPARHKSRHRGRDRVIPIGPQGQAVILTFLAEGVVDQSVPLFSPYRAREERFAAQRAGRKSKVPPCQVNRRQKEPKRVPLVLQS